MHGKHSQNLCSTCALGQSVTQKCCPAELGTSAVQPMAARDCCQIVQTLGWVGSRQSGETGVRF